MSDEPTLREDEAEAPTTAAAFEPGAIIPELDLEGGTVFRVGEEVFATQEEAEAAMASPDEPEAEARGGGDDE